MENYPIIHLLTRHGHALAWAFAAAMPVGALLLFIAGATWPILPIGVFAGLVCYVLARSYVELIHIITETLMPR
jgi:hypothetical protein